MVLGGSSWKVSVRLVSGNGREADTCNGRYWCQRVFQARQALSLAMLANPDQGRPAVAVKQVRVSDLSGQQAGEEQFAKLIVHEHPQ
jgi:hypothetical protein